MTSMLFLTLLFAMNTNNSLIAFNFNQLKTNQIMVVNDSVMGGKSSSKFEFLPQSIQFTGHVSLKNNGGFASLRMLWPFEKTTGYNKIQLKLIGDGQTYQFRLRTNLGLDGAAYIYEFKTVKNKQIAIEINANDFVPSFRGRKIRNMPVLKLSDAKQMGFLIADKQKGTFKVELHSISIH